ncbi:type IV secretion protein Rhs, partial [Shigella sonnei]|nr:type IV secretion protein Rhs [Shigella sonnei]
KPASLPGDQQRTGAVVDTGGG